MEDEKESKRIAKLLIPSQLIRAVFMSVVLYPVLPFPRDMSFGLQFIFMASLMFRGGCAAAHAGHTQGIKPNSRKRFIG